MLIACYYRVLRLTAQAAIMSCMAITDPVLAKFRAAMATLYGARIERVVLYGSRARGDARPDSDYDIAVFLKDLSSRWREGRGIADVELAGVREQREGRRRRAIVGDGRGRRPPLEGRERRNRH